MNKKFKRIYIELSNYCNLSCVFCTSKDKNNRMLSYDNFIHILNEVTPFTDEVLFHVLGEPLIHPNFIEFSNLVKDKGLKLQITTNGRLIEKNYDKLLNSYFTTLNLSLNSLYDLNYQEKCHYLDLFIKFIFEYKKINPKSVFHLRLWANTNQEILKNNEEIFKYLEKHFGSFQRNDRVRLSERIILSYENEFKWPELSGNITDGYCLGGKTHIGILANGVVTICCLDSYGYTNLGNIFETKLSDILKSDKYINTIESFKNNKCYLELCKYCTFKR